MNKIISILLGVAFNKCYEPCVYGVRGKPSLAFCHKSHKQFIREWDCFDNVDSDMEFRSLCSQKFAEEFYKVNK